VINYLQIIFAIKFSWSSRLSRFAVWSAAVLLSVFTGCGGGDGSNVECDESIEINYETWGEGFLATHCQGCHASGAPYRYGAPANITFDTESQMVLLYDSVWRTTVEERVMPPAGGVSEDDLYLLQQWLVCGL